MNISERLKELRKKKGFSQNELASKAQISRSYLADVERGRYNPSLQTLQSIADSIGVAVKDFFTDEAQPKTVGEPKKQEDKKMPRQMEQLTDEQVEFEIERLTRSEAVRLALAEQRQKYRRRNRMYQLRFYEKRGKELMAQGFSLDDFSGGDDDVERT